MEFYVKFIISLIACICLWGEAHAQALAKKIDHVMEKFIELDQFSGSILLAKDGKVLYAKAFGEADKEHHVSNSLKTKFDIGSIGKVFVGISILQLSERGKLNIFDPVVKHLKSFPFGEKITIYHLLTHTSGLKNYFSHPDYEKKKYQLREVNDALELIYDEQIELDELGKRFTYSNSGIAVLGALIEAVSGLKYKDYLQRYILSPAKMLDTGFYFLDEVVENRATGYIKNPDGTYAKNIFSTIPVNASGGLSTTAEDLLRLDQALYDNTLLNDDSKEKMFTAYIGAYGYTMKVDNKYDNKIVGHGGVAPGLYADFKRYLNDKYVLIVLSNYDHTAGGQLCFSLSQ